MLSFLVNRFGKLSILWIVLIFISCNSDFPNLLKEEYTDNGVAPQATKVLLIIADGVRGNALNDIDPKNLRNISLNSLYSHTSLGDYGSNEFTRESGLANIFTGQKSAKHGVLTSLETLSSQTFIQRLKANDTKFRSSALTADNSFAQYLLNGVDDKKVLASDDEVVSSFKQTIKEDAQSSLFIAHLSDVNKAGKNNSFESNNINYRAAILKLDSQLDEMIVALRQRPLYSSEKWLVIITSSIGGDISYVDPLDKTLYADNKRNTFTYFYSPSFTRKYLGKPTSSSMPFSGSGIRLQLSSGNTATSAELYDNSKMNIPSNQSITMTFFIKQNSAAGTIHNYPPFFTKRQNTDVGTGWQFILADGKVQAGFSGTSPGKLNSGLINDAKWHVITYVLDRTNKTAKIYTDGEVSHAGTAGTTNITNSYPMIFGKNPNSTSTSGDITLTNLQIFDRAFSDADVKQYSKLAYLTNENIPYYNNLIGYWPFYDDNGSRIVNDVVNKTGVLRILNDLSWSSFDEVVPFITPRITDDTYKLVPNLVDIPFFIYQWYGIVPTASWALDGQAWTPPYAIMTY